MSCGVRCAETTRASHATPNSPTAWAAASITGQSESDPMTIATRGVSSAVSSTGSTYCRGRKGYRQGLLGRAARGYVGGVDTRSEIREFLTSRRARLKAADVGLPDYGPRRVPGLRRE